MPCIASAPLYAELQSAVCQPNAWPGVSVAPQILCHTFRLTQSQPVMYDKNCWYSFGANSDTQSDLRQLDGLASY